jgi:hypothetical protein
MADKSVVGDLINFRGLVYSPINENGVIFLFGKVMEDLNMYIEEIKPGFPDCIGRRFTGKGWERITIEFEYASSNFQQHGHDPHKCDMIVCWIHDWKNCPLEVIELKEVIKTLPNKPIGRPDKNSETEQISIEEHFANFPPEVRQLFETFDEKVKTISDEIWFKVTGRPGVTYYSPERVFIYLRFQKQSLRLTVFTNGEELSGVENFTYERGGAKWGRLFIRSKKDIDKAIAPLKKSLKLIKEAFKANEPTGWYAELEDEADETEKEEVKPRIRKKK